MHKMGTKIATKRQLLAIAKAKRTLWRRLGDAYRQATGFHYQKGRNLKANARSNHVDYESFPSLLAHTKRNLQSW